MVRLKPKSFTFRPPKTNRLIISLAKRALPVALRLVPKVVAVEVNKDGLLRLRELLGQRVLLTPSHSGGMEPYVLFHLAKLLGTEFNYLAAKEVFEKWMRGWFMQHLGAYSIVRGASDTKSFTMTRRLLVDGRRWLVAFPEGEVCGQNDTLLPFQQGVAQLAFWAYEDLAKQGDAPPLYLVPAAIKYVYLRDMTSEIDHSLPPLEDELSLTPDPAPTRYRRLRRVGEAVLSVVEKAHNVRPSQSARLNDRIQYMKELLVARVETALGAATRPQVPLRDRIRDLLNAIDRIVYDEPEGADYEIQLHQRRQELARGLCDDLLRVQRFIALHEGYVDEKRDDERFLDILGLIELEVFGKRRVRGPRKALVRVGEPLNLSSYFPRYKSDKRATLQEVTGVIESSVRRLLDELIEKRTAD